MNKEYEGFNKSVETIIKGYRAIDDIKYVISQDLVKLENLWRNQSKILEMKKSTPTFQNFLVENLAKTYAQVIPVLRVGKYIKQQGVSLSDLSLIPLNKLEIITKAGVKWTDDVKLDLEVKGYNDIKYKYDKKTINNS